MIDSLAEEELALGTSVVEARPVVWKDVLRADLDRALERGGDRWSRAMMVVAWIHLSCFLACQVLYDPSVQRDPRLLFIWAGELAAVVAVLRVLVGADWLGSSSLSVVTRLWATFLILTCDPQENTAPRGRPGEPRPSCPG